MTTKEQRVAEAVRDELNRIIASDPALSEMFTTHEARWRYYTANGIGMGRLFHKRGNAIYCFSTEKVDGKYVSFTLVNTKKGGPAVRRQSVSHRTRTAAKARAKRLRDAAKGASRD